MVDKKQQKSVDSGGEIQIEIDEEVHQTKIEFEEDFVLKTESSDLA